MKKEDIVPYVIGVQFRWQFDETSYMYSDGDEEQIGSIHIVEKDGKIIDPISASWMSDLSEFDNDLNFVGDELMYVPEYGNDEWDIVKVFNLAQTLSGNYCEPILIYDRVSN